MYSCYGNLRSRVVDRKFCIELAVGNATRPLLGYKREKPQRALFRARVNCEGLDERMLSVDFLFTYKLKIQIIKCYMFKGLNYHLLVFEFWQLTLQWNCFKLFLIRIKLRITSAKKIQIIKCYMFEGLNCHLLIFEFLCNWDSNGIVAGCFWLD